MVLSPIFYFLFSFLSFIYSFTSSLSFLPFVPAHFFPSLRPSFHFSFTPPLLCICLSICTLTCLTNRHACRRAVPFVCVHACSGLHTCIVNCQSLRNCSLICVSVKPLLIGWMISYSGILHYQSRSEASYEGDCWEDAVCRSSYLRRFIRFCVFLFTRTRGSLKQTWPRANMDQVLVFWSQKWRFHSSGLKYFPFKLYWFCTNI